MKCQNQDMKPDVLEGGGEQLREIKIHFDSKINLTKRNYLKITKWAQTHFPSWKLPLTKRMLYYY